MFCVMRMSLYVPLSVLVAAQLHPEQNRGNAAPALGPRAIGNAYEEARNLALPRCKDRIPAERNFCSFPNTHATDNLALPPAFFILERLTAPSRSAESQSGRCPHAGRG